MPQKDYSSSTDSNPYPDDKSFYGNEKLKMPTDKLGNWLAGLDTGTRMLDAYSTLRARSNPELREAVLPQALADSTPGMYGFSGGVALANTLGSKFLVNHGHPKLGHLLQMIDIGYDLPPGIKNMTFPTKPTPRNNGPVDPSNPGNPVQAPIALPNPLPPVIGPGYPTPIKK